MVGAGASGLVQIAIIEGTINFKLFQEIVQNNIRVAVCDLKLYFRHTFL